MAKKKKSCLGHLFRGCGCLLLLVLLLAVGVGVFTLFNQPKPPEFDIAVRQDSLPSESGQDEQESGIAGVSPLPIRVTLDMRMADLEIVTDAPPGQFKVNGRYDRANFDLDTNLSRRGKGWVYRVDFKSRQRLFTHIDAQDAPNHLTLHLPHTTPLDLDMDLGLTKSDIDLSGASLAGLKVKFNLGKLVLRMNDANPIPLAEFEIDASMANLEILDIQHFGFTGGKLKMTMGEARVYNSGPLAQDTNIGFAVNMAQLYLQIPEDTRLSVHEESVMGGYEGPRQLSTSADAPLLDLRGRVTMGSVEVETATTKPSAALVLKGIILKQDVAAAIARYHEFKTLYPDRFHFHPGGLQSLASFLLEGEREADARAILALSIREFPTAAESYLMLADIDARAGNFQAAVQSLEEGLRRIPDSLAIQNRLERLKRERDQP